MVKQKLRDYDHVQVEITGFPKEVKPISKISRKQKILTELKRRKKMRYMQIMNFLGHSGYNSMLLNDLIAEKKIVKKKYDCGTCEYFELAEV